MDDILEKIKNLGLNSYEAKVYLALFERESLSVSEISQISHVPKSRIYDTLDSLMIEGLAILKPGKHKRYSAASPSSFKEKFINRIEEYYTEQKKMIEKTALTLQKNYESRLENGFDDSPLDFVKILKDPFQIYKAFIELFSRAEKEVCSFTRPPYIFPMKKQIDELLEVQRAAYRRGVKDRTVRILTPDDEDRIPYLGEENEEVRIIDNLPMKMLICDDKVAWYTLVDPIHRESSYTCFVVEHKGFVEGFKTMFEVYWNKAKEYGALKK